MESTIKNNPNREYKDVIKNIALFKELIASEKSERAAAKEINIPRSTIQNWQKTKVGVQLNAKVYEFFQTPEGYDFFNILVIAIEFVITQVAKTGIRMAELILELTGLSEIIGCSYGILQSNGEIMETEINCFGHEEKARLSSGMPQKKITMAKDETFNSVTQLIAIEPVSNFIIAEDSVDKRDSETWDATMNEGLEGINAEVIQNVNDQGAAIKRYNKEHLASANESPDLYHILHEIQKATAGPLASKAGKFTKILEKQNTQRACEIRRKEALIKKGERDQARKVDREIDRLDKEIEKTGSELLKISNWKQTVATATFEISRNYHPYDLATGETKTLESLSEILEKEFATIRLVVKQMNISKKCLKRVEKAYKLVPQMLTTLRFYSNNFAQILNEQSLSLDVENIIRENLAPVLYLEIAANKMQTAEKKNEILQVAKKLIDELNANKTWQRLGETEQSRLKKLTLELVQVFQRSSSCVEGRNSHLQLWHHGVGTLSDRKLKSITVVHNYFLKRGDGTTAAERFFGKKPKDLFQYLLDRMPGLVRPRQKTSRQKEVFAMSVI